MKLVLFLLFSLSVFAQTRIDFKQINFQQSTGTLLRYRQIEAIRSQLQPNCSEQKILLFTAYPERGYAHVIQCQLPMTWGSCTQLAALGFNTCWYSVAYDDTTFWWSSPGPGY